MFDEFVKLLFFFGDVADEGAGDFVLEVDFPVFISVVEGRVVFGEFEVMSRRESTSSYVRSSSWVLSMGSSVPQVDRSYLALSSFVLSCSSMSSSLSSLSARWTRLIINILLFMYLDSL